LFQDIAKVGEEVVAAEKTEADKRKKLEKILLPLAGNVVQVRALDKKIRKVKGDELDKLLAESVRRRILVDILQPIENFRPGDVLSQFTEKVADLNATKIEDLEAQLLLRLDNAIADKYVAAVHQGKNWEGEKRETVEKRQAVAFLLFSIAHVNKPDGTPLFSRGPERAQVVAGLYEFSIAAQAYIEALTVLEKRVITQIKGDREGDLIVGANKVERTPGFVDRYPVQVQKIRVLIGAIDQAEKRLKEIQGQQQKAQKNFEDRTQHLGEIAGQLVEERAKTAKLLEQLRLIQSSLFRAQLELATLPRSTSAWKYRFARPRVCRREVHHERQPPGQNPGFPAPGHEHVGSDLGRQHFSAIHRLGLEGASQGSGFPSPSEYDKRAAALKEAIAARDLVYPPFKPAQASLRDAEERFPQNSLWYDKELTRLKTDPNPIEVKEIKYIGGVLDLDTPGKSTGKPILDNPVAGIQKSYVSYLEDLDKIEKDSADVTKETRTWIEKAKDITFKLNGLDDAKKKVKTGCMNCWPTNPRPSPR